MQLLFSIIIPVFNRPKEVEELLNSICKQNYTNNFEVIIVEDGSKKDAKAIVNKYIDKLDISYFFKKNSGAGLSRNFGMQKAKGNYFIILDSDVLLHENYLEEVQKKLLVYYTDAFGGPDKAHHSFTPLQKAINYSMTSILTTGGIRGNKKTANTFQPRSFNMGLSKKAFETSKGFSSQKIGEDIDLTFRLWQNGFKTQLILNAFVYHKRRSSLKEFFYQTFAFGTQRPYLNLKYPKTSKITYWFPTLFCFGFFISILSLFFNFPLLFLLFFLYLSAIFFNSYISNNNFYIALLSIVTSLVQFFGYGLGFLKSTLKIIFKI